MRANDGSLYVVKFQGNPHNISTLDNEMLGAKPVDGLGVPVPRRVVVALAGLSDELYFETLRGRQPILPELHLGYRLVITGLECRFYDLLAHWKGNRDTWQFISWKYRPGIKSDVTFIDNGHRSSGRIRFMAVPSVSS
jgi:hypothetical protein